HGSPTRALRAAATLGSRLESGRQAGAARRPEHLARRRRNHAKRCDTGRRHARDRYCRNRRYPRRRAVTARRAIPPDDRSYAPAARAAFRRPTETALLRRARRRFPRMLTWRRTTITPLTPRPRRAS